MKLKEFIANLQELAKENPEALEFEVVYSKDDEGNGYDEVYFAPSIGQMDEDSDFRSHDGLIEDGYDEDEIELNSVCIN